MGFADAVRAFEQGFNRRGIARRRKQGWVPLILPYRGYGSTTALRVLARAIMANPHESFLLKSPFTEQAQRGWRQFFTTQVGFLPVTICLGNNTFSTRTDESGYIDFFVENHGLTPGIHSVTIVPRVGEAVEASVEIVDPSVTQGIISDIDDTVMVTWLPRPMLAAWNSFVLHTNSRKAVPGMASFYREIMRDTPNCPVFYLSTGAWNTVATLEAFLSSHGFPDGPLLMTDWGPTPTGLFRSGQEHKKTQLRNLLIMFPHIRWVLVGDDGQHDPLIYQELAKEHPSRVEGIALRQLDVVEQVLAHGTPLSVERPFIRRASRDVPVIRGSDGYELLEKWAEISGLFPSSQRRFPRFSGMRSRIKSTGSPHTGSSQI